MTLPAPQANSASNGPSSTTNPPQSQHFLLKWNNHRSNMVNVFESLLQSENLVDVTIAVEGKFLKAHKIVLSACSPYFQSMFVEHVASDKYPVLVFHDMKHSHLKTLLDFMYRGEISIDERDLGEVLKVAEALSIRGLSSFESDDEEGDKPDGNQCEEEDKKEETKDKSNTNTNTQPPPTQNGSDVPVKKKKIKEKKDNQKKFCDASTPSVKKVVGGRKAEEKRESSEARSEVRNEIQVKREEVKPQFEVIKKKRGRQPKKILTDEIIHSKLKLYSQVPPPALQIPPTTVTTSTPTPITSLQKRPGVRRRLPRRFPGVPTRLKRVKLSKLDPSLDLLDPSLDSLDPSLTNPDSPDCEPLSEMSVRGLDLFKYASIEDGVYRCIECEKLCIPKTFKNKYSFQRHAFLYHEGNMRKVFPCPVCAREFSRPDKMKNHMKSIHGDGNGNGKIIDGQEIMSQDESSKEEDV